MTGMAWWQSCTISGTAAMIAEGVTIPFDTAKVRLQTQQIQAGVVPKYRGPLQTIYTIVQESGVQAPFRGVIPGCHRMFIFTGIRLGLLDRMKNTMRLPDGSITLAREAGAAWCTSAFAITLANPSDVVKVRFQNTAGSQYSSVMGAYVQIARDEGIFGGLYRGYSANLVRNCTISAAELTGYCKAKECFLAAGFADGPLVHTSSGFLAGLVAVLLGSPADVVGTRLITHQGDTGSLAKFCLDMLRNEGPGSFYKGFVPNLARLGSYNVVLWSSYEQLRMAVIALTT